MIKKLFIDFFSKAVLLLVMIICFVQNNSSAQQAFTATWALSSNANVVVTGAGAAGVSAATGTLTGAANQNFINCTGSGWAATNWPSGGSPSLATKYWQYTITPASGYSISITNVSFNIFDGCFTNCQPHNNNDTYGNYSTDGFATSTNQFNNCCDKAWYNLNGALNVTLATNAVTFTYRVGCDDGYGGSTVANMMRNLIITGTSTLLCTPPPAVTVNSSGTFCGQTTLLAFGGTGGTIYFQDTTSGGTSTAKPSSAQIITASGTYYFYESYDGQCWSPEGSATVIITPGPCLQWLNQSCTIGSGSYINGGSIFPAPVLATASVPTTPANYGYVYWSFSAIKNSTYYFDLCSSTGTTMSRLRIHNFRNLLGGNNYCEDSLGDPTLQLENISNGCVGTGVGLSKLIWTCQASGTYYLESAGDNLTYWGVQTNQTATLSYKTIPSSSITCSDVFYDKGMDGTNGSSANYNNDENWIYTYYPTDTVADAINVQFVSFSTSPGDILCVYNGNSINAPIIGCYSGPSITGAFSSTANDGSLTFQFTSDDSLISTGWEANVSCVASLRVDQHVAENKFSIYPNPVKDKLWVMSYGLRVNKIEIYNLVGDKVYTQPTTSNLKSKTSVDVRALPAGLYFIRVGNESGDWNGRFVKQ